jgi:hypothetical protein
MSEPAVEPAVEPAAPDEDVWTGPSQEEWEATQARLAQADELVRAVEQSRAREAGPLSQYDPEFRSELDQYLEQRLTPYETSLQQQRANETEELMKDALHDLSVSGGEFDIAEARRRFDEYAGPMVERYGMTEKAAQKALEAAAVAQREYEASIEARGVERYQNQMRGISQARREPPAAGAPAASVHVSPPGGDEQELVRRYAAEGRFQS